MKAIEKDRTRRYDTADAMAADLERYLTNDPVEARPPTTAYRARKFARRNRGLMTGVGLVVSLLLVLIGALGYGMMRMRAQRDATARAMIIDRARIIMDNMNAVRSYTTERVRPHLVDALESDGDFPRESVPAFAANEVFERFRRSPAYATFLYKEAAPNPTNPRDLTDDFERGVVDQFRADAELDEVTGFRPMRGVDRFYIARRLTVNDISCLRCHSTPDQAPAGMTTTYGPTGGFGWTLGETIAAQFVYVPASAVRAGTGSSDLIAAAVLGGAFLVLAGVSVVLVKRA
ncbi:MAG: DUF3365 domain-containing protein [Phycisphaerales bacterium]